MIRSEYFAFLILLLIMAHPVSAQLSGKGFYQSLLPKAEPSFKTELDSTRSVKNLSAHERRVLFRKLLAADQKYREELHKPDKNPDDNALWQRIKANDRANQAILLRLVQTYGWPTQRLRDKDAPFTAWLIVWHCNRFDDYLNFEPYLRTAAQRKLIPPNHYASLAKKWRGWN